MKKGTVLAVAVLAALALLLSGCATYRLPDGKIKFTAESVHTDEFRDIEDAAYPEKVLIQSPKELNDYIDANGTRYQLNNMYENQSFIQAVEDCRTDGFFAEQVLLLVLVEENSSDIRNEVESVSVSKDVLNVDISRVFPSVSGPSGKKKAQYHLIIRLARQEYGEIRLNFTTKTAGM